MVLLEPTILSQPKRGRVRPMRNVLTDKLKKRVHFIEQGRSMLLGDLRSFRRLSPAFSLKGVVFCWECTLCHKLFMHMPHDAPPTPAELGRISSEFNQHDCAIQFAVTRDKLKKVPAA